MLSVFQLSKKVFCFRISQEIWGTNSEVIGLSVSDRKPDSLALVRFS